MGDMRDTYILKVKFLQRKNGLLFKLVRVNTGEKNEKEKKKGFVPRSVISLLYTVFLGPTRSQ